MLFVDGVTKRRESRTAPAMFVVDELGLWHNRGNNRTDRERKVARTSLLVCRLRCGPQVSSWPCLCARGIARAQRTPGTCVALERHEHPSLCFDYGALPAASLSLTRAPDRDAAGDPLTRADRAVGQAAAALRARRLLRRVVLGAVFSPLVCRARLSELCREPARTRFERRRRDVVHHGTRRLRGRRRIRGGTTECLADPDRSFDGRCDRRAHSRKATGARCSVARAGAARRPVAGRDAARRRASGLPAADGWTRSVEVIRGRARGAATVLLQRRCRSRDPQGGTAAPFGGIATRVARSFAAAALGAPASQSSTAVRPRRGGRSHLPAERRPRDGNASWCRGDDPPGTRAHADAGARLAGRRESSRSLVGAAVAEQTTN